MNAPVRIDLNDVSSFPSRRVEGWKWTDVRRHLREVPEAAPKVLAKPADVLSFEGPFDALVQEAVSRLEASNYDGSVPGVSRTTFVNGRDWTGANVATRHAAPKEHVSAEPNLHALMFVGQGGGGWQSSIGLTVGEGEHLVLLEAYQGDDASIGNVALNVVVLEGGRLDRIVVAADGADAVAFSRADVELREGAEFTQTIVTTGARLQRFETHVRHPGQGASVRMDGLYALSGERHADLTSTVTHEGLDGQTSQLVKGVVRDTARGVFQGKIVVERGADGTDARMAHNALILSERGEVDAKPELIIYADDVQCAHGNTVGTLDESALFYMQQRGLPAEEARALLTQAFLFEVVDRIEHEGARETVREWLTARL